MRPSLLALSALLSLLVPACVSPPGMIEDPDGSFRRDGGPRPIFRGCGDASIGDAEPEGGCPDGDVVQIDAGMPDAGPPPPPCNEVTFELDAPSASSVWVTGSFVAVGGVWPGTLAAGALPLTNDGAGHWTLTTLIEPIQRHLYKFIVDGSTTWIPDPGNPVSEPDGVGGSNSVLDVCSAACGDLSVFDWRDTVMYFAMTDRFRDSDSMSMPVSGATDGDAARARAGSTKAATWRGVTAKSSPTSRTWASRRSGSPRPTRTAMWPAPRSIRAAIRTPTPGTTGTGPRPANIDYTDPANPTAAPARGEPHRHGTTCTLLVDSAHATEGANGHGMQGALRLRDEARRQRERALRAHPTGSCGTTGASASAAPRICGTTPSGVCCARSRTYLPKFDFRRADVRAWSVSDAVWWAKSSASTATASTPSSTSRWTGCATCAHPPERGDPAPDGGRFYLVGETFAYDDQDLSGRFVEPATMLDGQFDFPFKARLCEALFTAGGRLDTFAGWIAGNDSLLRPGAHHEHLDRQP
jgi:hypothetical protein